MDHNSRFIITSMSDINRHPESDDLYINNQGMIWGILIVEDPLFIHAFVGCHVPRSDYISTQTISSNYLTYGHHQIPLDQCPPELSKYNSWIYLINLPEKYINALIQGTMDLQLNTIIQYLINKIYTMNECINPQTKILPISLVQHDIIYQVPIDIYCVV